MPPACCSRHSSAGVQASACSLKQSSWSCSAWSCLLLLVFKQHRVVLLWPLLALAGWTNFAVRTAVLSPADLRVMLGQEPVLATIRGTLAETPRLKIIVRDEQEQWRSVARVRVDALRRDQDFEPAVGEVLVTTPDVLGPDFFSGQSVEISGVLAPPPPPLAEGLFDFQDYLATRGIYYQVKTESTNDWKLREPRLAPSAAHRPISELVAPNPCAGVAGGGRAACDCCGP